MKLLLRGTLEEFEACVRAARARSQTDRRDAVVYYWPERGGYGWDFEPVREGVEIKKRFRKGKEVETAP